MTDPLLPVWDALPPPWRAALAGRIGPADLAPLDAFLAGAGETYPPAPSRFTALALTPPDAVRVVILGQDPYHGPGQAHGLAFSVPPGVRVPPSLANIRRELASDTGVALPPGGTLTGWARQGVLLLNTVMTVAPGRAGAHRGRGWERLTGAILAHLAAGPRGIVFVLWGRPAQQTAARVPGLADPPHHVIASAHPSPLSARRGFLGSRPFSAVNAALAAGGEAPIRWAEIDAGGRVGDGAA